MPPDNATWTVLLCRSRSTSRFGYAKRLFCMFAALAETAWEFHPGTQVTFIAHLFPSIPSPQSYISQRNVCNDRDKWQTALCYELSTSMLSRAVFVTTRTRGQRRLELLRRQTRCSFLQLPRGPVCGEKKRDVEELTIWLSLQNPAGVLCVIAVRAPWRPSDFKDNVDFTSLNREHQGE